MPPQTNDTIGDYLSTAGVTWAWYAGAMQYAIDHPPFVSDQTDPRGNMYGYDAHGNYWTYDRRTNSYRYFGTEPQWQARCYVNFFDFC